MSLRDPTVTRPGRVTFAVLVFVASLAAAGVAGWGWAIGAVPEQAMGGHFVALYFGQMAAIGLLVASGFAQPVRWQAVSRAAGHRQLRPLAAR